MRAKNLGIGLEKYRPKNWEQWQLNENKLLVVENVIQNALNSLSKDSDQSFVDLIQKQVIGLGLENGEINPRLKEVLDQRLKAFMRRKSCQILQQGLI